MNIYSKVAVLHTALLKHKIENKIFSHRNKYVVGALALDSNDNIISLSFNSYIKTHPYQKELAIKNKKMDACFLHAEVSAIIKSKGKAKTLFISRLTSKNKLALAKPCCICSMAIKEAQIKFVYYTNNNEDIVMLNTQTNEELIFDKGHSIENI